MLPLHKQNVGLTLLCILFGKGLAIKVGKDKREGGILIWRATEMPVCFDMMQLCTERQQTRSQHEHFPLRRFKRSSEEQ